MFNQLCRDILVVHDGIMSQTGAIGKAMWFNNIKHVPFHHLMPNKPYNGCNLFVLGGAETRTIVNFFWDDGLVINVKKCVGNPCKFGGTCMQLLLKLMKTTKLHLAVDRLV